MGGNRRQHRLADRARPYNRRTENGNYNHSRYSVKPQSIFVNSMSDLFHEEIPDDFIFRVFEVMNNAHWHQFQILTKRPERLSKFIEWKSHIGMGVSVENQHYVYRINDLTKTGAKVKFISLEDYVRNFL